MEHPDGGELSTESYQRIRPDEPADAVARVTMDRPEMRNAQDPLMLAELTIDGEERDVIMQAPKNGYFYVLDRETGEFISAEGIAPINWSLGLDENGRPTINPKAKYWETGEPFVARPGIGGAHNWQPMSYSRQTGLVYIPVMESPTIHRGRQSEGNNVYGDRNPAFMMEENEKLRQEVLDSQYGYLLAWDPARQEEVWRVDWPGPFNGGVLSTAGNLVFQGEGNGEFAAFDAETGDKLWRMDAYGGIIAAPMSYTVDGEQYVAVLQGWGGGFAMGAGQEAMQSGRKRNISRVLAFKLGGDETLPEPPPWPELNPPPLEANEETVMRGEVLYQRNCSRCHGGRAVAGGTITDLRYSAYLHTGIWHDIVLAGALRDAGMIPFGETLSREDSAAIRAYVTARAHEKLAEDAE
jgi:mono/diheme cytochrome c family protein